MDVYYNDIDPFCCKVLRKQIGLGNLPQGFVDERDIREVRADELAGYKQIHLFAGIGGIPLACGWAGMPSDFSIITGGFPCQPFSVCGDRLGAKDERAIWPEMFRIIKEIRPAYVVAENVYGFLNIDNGHSADLLCADLESSGYEAPAIFDATADFAGVPTMERHVWFVSKAIDERRKGSEAGAHKDNGNEGQLQGADKRRFNRRHISETRFCRVGERVSRKLDRHQRDRLKGLGNAVSPEAAYPVLKVIVDYERQQI